MAIHSPRKLTYQDFERIPEDGLRHEILDGVHVVSPAPSLRHQWVSRGVFRALDSFVAARGLGEVFFAPFDVVLSDHDVVEPDLLFISRERLAILTEANVQGAPDLLVEVLSPGTRRRDLGQKLVRYEKLGVLEYWVVDPKTETALIFRKTGDSFAPPLRLAAEAGDRLATPLLPGFGLPLREVFGR
jgi:Uma2 family endonuclease